MYRQSRSQRFSQRHRHMKLPLLLVALFLFGAFVVFIFADDQDDIEESDQQRTEIIEENQQQPEEPLVSLPSVQSELDDVLLSVRGTHSVLVEDPETGDVLASHRPNEIYFTASIYKLYVAYMGLQDVQAGIHEPDELYNQGRTRLECIEAMLKDSDSPCPEKMWVEQGRDVGNVRLAELGLTNTDLLGMETTPHDANVILNRLYQGLDLDDEYKQFMLDALRDFPEREFREGLPSAFDDEQVVIYDKPGLYDEGWLDAAIIELPSGRAVAVSIYSDSASSKEVRTIAGAIIAPLIVHES